MIQISETIDRRSLEAAVLGSMVLYGSSETAEYAASELDGTEFMLPGHRAIFRAVGLMTQRGIPVDAITLADELIRVGDYEQAGGAAGLAEVFEAVPHSEHCRFYVQQLQALYRRDGLAVISERLKGLAQDPACDPSDTITMIVNELETMRAGTTRRSELITAAAALEAFDNRNKDPRQTISTGLSQLDRIFCGGLRPGQLVVIGGRPGFGKSALMGQMILNAGRSQRAGLMASLEMTAGEIAGRGLMTIDRRQFAQLPVWFAECSQFTKLEALLRLARRRHSIQLAAVDYLQLIETPIGRNELRERQVATMSRGLKRLAMELQIPILLGSQLNRESEKRGRPSLADLRESGAIEQDADIVVLLSGDAETDERELIVAKHRGGACGIVRATFDRPKFWFNDSVEPWTGSL